MPSFLYLINRPVPDVINVIFRANGVTLSWFVDDVLKFLIGGAYEEYPNRKTAFSVLQHSCTHQAFIEHELHLWLHETVIALVDEVYPSVTESGFSCEETVDTVVTFLTQFFNDIYVLLIELSYLQKPIHIREIELDPRSVFLQPFRYLLFQWDD